MRIGISTWLWLQRFTADRIDLIDKIAALGFDQIEFPLEDIDQFDYAHIGSVLRDRGLGVSLTAVLRLDRDLTVDDPVRNQAAVTYLQHAVDAVTALGGNRIGGGLYGGVGRVWYPSADQHRRELDHVARQLRPAGRYAHDHGVVLAIETLVRFRSSFVNTMAEALELAALVDSPGIQVMADTFHMNVEEKDMVQAIEQAGPHLAHVHANDSNRWAPGSGHLDWTGVRGALQRARYDGALVIEVFGGEIKPRADQSLDMQREEIAREGCRFLREFFA